MMLIGISNALGIWLPSFRTKWKGSDVDFGPLSYAATTFFIFIIGLMLLANAIPKRLVPWLAVGAMACWILGCVGYALDVRRWKRTAAQTLTPNSASSRIPDERRGWEFAALGTSFLVVTIWLSARGR